MHDRNQEASSTALLGVRHEHCICKPRPARQAGTLDYAICRYTALEPEHASRWPRSILLAARCPSHRTEAYDQIWAINAWRSSCVTQGTGSKHDKWIGLICSMLSRKACTSKPSAKVHIRRRCHAIEALQYRHLSMAPELPSCKVHTGAVAGIASRVQSFYRSKSPFRIYHGSTNSTRKSARRHDNILDISHLDHVLSIDTVKKLAYVEPNVPMDQLVIATLKLGLVPPVVMEFPGITVGGGFAGTSGESSSFKHGLFDRTVQAVEIVLGNGEVTVASREDPQTTELFTAAAASFGTLGVVTLLALELVDAKPFVELTYVRVASIDKAIEHFEAETMTETVDYMDGILFAEDRGVVCLGKLTDAVPEHAGTPRTFSQPWDDWFYINAQRILADETRNPRTEYIPIQDYLFRYERGAFWISKYTYHYFAVPLNRFTRWLLDTYTHTRIMYSALHHSGLSSQYIIQDVAIPYDNAAAFVSHLDEHFQNYPVWLCPLRMRGRSSSSANGLLAQPSLSKADDESLMSAARPDMMMNFGVWGPLGKHNDFIDWNKAFEAKIHSLGGQKWLYSHTFYTEDEFWMIHGDREQYDTTRAKYHASSLPSIYEKVRATESGLPDGSHRSWWAWLYVMFWSIWPLRGLYGWLLCILSNDYLLPQKSFWNLQQQSRGSKHAGAHEECPCYTDDQHLPLIEKRDRLKVPALSSSALA